jgi:hypothetical protein
MQRILFYPAKPRRFRSLCILNEKELLFGRPAYWADRRWLQSLVNITAHNAAPTFHRLVPLAQAEEKVIVRLPRLIACPGIYHAPLGGSRKFR